MNGSFRQSMAWLHTWVGLLLGWLLVAIFITGTSAYFREEITLWMEPETHDSTLTPNTLDMAVAVLNDAMRFPSTGELLSMLAPEPKASAPIMTPGFWS